MARLTNTKQTRFAAMWPRAALAFVLAFPSLGLAVKYLGIAGAVAYPAFVLAVVLLCYEPAMRLAQLLSERQALILGLATFALLVTLFALVYPVVNTHTAWSGSDRDDALDLAVGEILHGRYPYYPATYLDNPISPLPGALFLAMPFVLVGGSALQNLFWLPVLAGILAHYFRSFKEALAVIWCILALCPAVLQEFLSGGDLLANSIYVLAFAYIATRPGLGGWKSVAAAALLGVGLASRASFFFITPLIVAMWVRQGGWRSALLNSVITLTTFAAVTLPFYLYDPLGFSPLHATFKLARFSFAYPGLEIAVPLSTGILAIWLATQLSQSGDTAFFLKSCGLVLAPPVVVTVVLWVVQYGQYGVQTAGYGVIFLFFAVAGLWRVARAE